MNFPMKRFIVHRSGECEMPLYGVEVAEKVCFVWDTANDELFLWTKAEVVVAENENYEIEWVDVEEPINDDDA